VVGCGGAVGLLAIVISQLMAASEARALCKLVTPANKTVIIKASKML